MENEVWRWVSPKYGRVAAPRPVYGEYGRAADGSAAAAGHAATTHHTRIAAIELHFDGIVSPLEGWRARADLAPSREVRDL
jgi:hypothetical protein